MMLAQELREKFLGFFAQKGHKIIPSASLIPKDDPTALFINSGVQPLVPYLLGERHALGKRLASCQRCMRTTDIDEVGDKTHLTFFEMLGNWSLGDYWKEEAIEWALEFLCYELGIAKNELEVTCFKGDETAPRDEEAANVWKKSGIKRIKFLGKKDNWWGPAGRTGPCGPDTEIFYKGIEIWNLVFMQYNKTGESCFEALNQKNVDTGMGLERMLALLQGKESVFETDLFWPGIKTKEQRIVADHLRAAVELISDGVMPSNTEQGYILRRLLRRAIALEPEFTALAEKITKNKKILNVITQEHARFGQALQRGLRELKRGKRSAFDIYQSYGLPLEVIKKYAQVNEQEFKTRLKEHQERSRRGAARFKSGLADESRQSVKYHTATHLLHSALRQVLGERIRQVGSNITSERLRFDFSYPEKLTAEQIKKVEGIVNQKIKQDLLVQKQEMTYQDAVKQGALAFFKEKYPERVTVFSIEEPSAVSGRAFSKEVCAGPHVKRTSDLGHFKIIKQESVGAGVRRIRAVLS